MSSTNRDAARCPSGKSTRLTAVKSLFFGVNSPRPPRYNCNPASLTTRKLTLEANNNKRFDSREAITIPATVAFAWDLKPKLKNGELYTDLRTFEYVIVCRTVRKLGLYSEKKIPKPTDVNISLAPEVTTKLHS